MISDHNFLQTLATSVSIPEWIQSVDKELKGVLKNC